MPEPLSDTSISSIPYSFSRTSTRVAPASMAFSTSSLTWWQGYVSARGGGGLGGGLTAVARSSTTWPVQMRCTELDGIARISDMFGASAGAPSCSLTPC